MRTTLPLSLSSALSHAMLPCRTLMWLFGAAKGVAHEYMTSCLGSWSSDGTADSSSASVMPSTVMTLPWRKPADSSSFSTTGTPPMASTSHMQARETAGGDDGTRSSGAHMWYLP